MRGLARAAVTFFAVIGVIATIQELRGQGKAPLEGARLRHIGVIVKDINSAVKVYADVFGAAAAAKTKIIDASAPMYSAEFPGNRNFSVKVAHFNLGNDVILEFIQPVDAYGPQHEQIQKYGNSLQHLAFSVPDVHQARQALVAKGAKWILGAPNYANAYVDMREQFGLVFELNAASPQ